ncbi:MAG: hypothetical protein AAGG01_14565 [Planctomycetota bacterium]
MKGVRFWSVIMAATWFLAGLGAGFLISSRRSEPGPWAAYAQELQSTFDLTGEQRSVLNQVLDRHARELNEIQRRHTAETGEAMEPELRALFSRTEAIIRGTIIPPSKRARFDELRRPHRVLNQDS